MNAHKDIRCDNCGKKLAEGSIKDGIIYIKCTKCGTIKAIAPVAVTIKK